MMGSILAGLDESPGQAEFDYEGNRMVKKYRGMGSLEAMESTSAVRYAVDKVKIKIAEGIVTKVPYRGSGYDFLLRLIVGKNKDSKISKNSKKKPTSGRFNFYYYNQI